MIKRKNMRHAQNMSSLQPKFGQALLWKRYSMPRNRSGSHIGFVGSVEGSSDTQRCSQPPSHIHSSDVVCSLHTVFRWINVPAWINAPPPTFDFDWTYLRNYWTDLTTKVFQKPQRGFHRNQTRVMVLLLPPCLARLFGEIWYIDTGWGLRRVICHLTFSILTYLLKYPLAPSRCTLQWISQQPIMAERFFNFLKYCRGQRNLWVASEYTYIKKNLGDNNRP